MVVPCSEPSSPNDSNDTQDGGGEVGVVWKVGEAKIRNMK